MVHIFLGNGLGNKVKCPGKKIIPSKYCNFVAPAVSDSGPSPAKFRLVYDIIVNKCSHMHDFDGCSQRNELFLIVSAKSAGQQNHSRPQAFSSSIQQIIYGIVKHLLAGF